jgi:tetratricopeptide (TPR) repeat protein
VHADYHAAVIDWVVVELEPGRAARTGLPERVAVPREHAAAAAPLERSAVIAWAADFAQDEPAHPLAPRLAGLVAAEPYRRLGLRLIEQDRDAEAARALAAAPELAPFDAGSRYNLAGALRRSGRHDEALDALAEIEWAYADEGAYHAACGRAWEAVGDDDRAIVAYERALELLPGDGWLLERLEALGALRRLDGPDGEPYWLRPADFERIVRHELAASAADPAGLVSLGERLASGGHWDLARAAGELAVAAAPAYAGGWALAGRALSELQDPGGRRALERAVELDPARADAVRALVLDVREPAGDVERALRFVEQHERSAAGWLVLGDLLAGQGRVVDAMGAYRRALELDAALPGADHARAAVARTGSG